MAKEAIDPNFDRSTLDLASWELVLIKLGEDVELEPVVEKVAEARMSGAKEADGGAGGGEAAVGDTAVVGKEGCCCLGLSPLFNFSFIDVFC
ncbi:hypothetical protein Hanom_Chr02g00136461 [Helianthus anomalus]